MLLLSSLYLVVIVVIVVAGGAWCWCWVLLVLVSLRCVVRRRNSDFRHTMMARYTSETAFQSWLHKIMVIEPFFNGLSPFSTIFHRVLCKINSQTHLKFIQGAAAPNEPYFNSTYTMKITIVNLINLSEAIYHTNVPLLKCNK